MLERWGRGVFVLVVVAFVAVLYLTATNTYNGDSYLSFHEAHSIVHDQDLYIDEHEPYAGTTYFFQQVNGHYVDFFPWTMGLVAAPSVVALDAAHAVGVGPGAQGLIENGQMQYVQMANGSMMTLIAVAAVLVTALSLARGTERHRRLVALAVALSFALGTTAWSVASRANWMHGASMAVTSVAVLAATRLAADRGAAWAAVLGAALAASYTVRPTNLSIALALGVWVIWCRPRRAPLAVLGAVLVLVPWFAINQATYGDWFSPYYASERASFAGNYLDRLATNLFSPARGLLLFSPIVLLALAGWWMAVRRSPKAERLPPSLAIALGAAAGAHWMAVSARDVDWWGGVGFGPRYMTDLLPWLAVLAVPAVSWLLDPPPERTRAMSHRLAVGFVGAALLWSVVVHAQGAYLRSTICWNYDPLVGESEMWAFSHSQLFSGIGAVGEAPIGSLFTEPCDQMPDV